ncbi:hypothetical protein HanXRQr2_Chr17g0805661 [Helianthus annuus]|uniref:Uncharacterized protein n=1 Tax=Helianthus annuus TaxID=4232 RepID=A0A251RQT4_HELAN|nr:hypothetical protein HanXRQr2_Chr17g0805661 [Helianthus annuus]
MGNLINAVNQLSYPAKCVHASWTVELSKLKAKIGIVQKIIISYGDVVYESIDRNRERPSWKLTKSSHIMKVL